MITRNNLKEVLEDLETEEIQAALESEKDYIGVRTHIFNAGWYAEITALDSYSKKYPINGGFCIDRESFARMLEENDIKF
jgi:hypothetical protein